MRYTLLGSSGLRVSEVALGTMTFGEAWGWGASEDECRRMFDAFVEAGGNFVDTAGNYTDGQSEEHRRLTDCSGSRALRDRDQVHAHVASRQTRTRAATTARISCRRSRRACADSVPTTSTSSGCTCGTG